MKTIVFFCLAVCLIGGCLLWANVHENPLPNETRADRILVEKAARRLTLYRQNRPLRSYRIALGRSPIGDKAQEGDNRTPEGIYRIARRNRQSRFHRALHISYPDVSHLREARNRGMAPGGDIMIHGIHNGLGWVGRLHRLADWTAGCIAVTNFEIDEIWEAVPDGTTIEIRP